MTAVPFTYDLRLPFADDPNLMAVFRGGMSGRAAGNPRVSPFSPVNYRPEADAWLAGWDHENSFRSAP